MVLTRTVKSCGSDAPIVGVKSAIRSAGDGVKKRGHRGEREVSRKTIARGVPGDFRCDRGDYARTLFILRARLRVHRAPGIPCALCYRGAKVLAKPGRIAPRDRGGVFERLSAHVPSIRHPEVRALRCTCTAGRASKDERPGRRPSRRPRSGLLRVTGMV